MRDLSEILRREQAAATLRRRYAMHPRAVPDSELVVTSREDREGAGILRELIDRMDPVMGDDHVTIIRLALPHRLMMQLELWGADTADMEASHDLEAWLYREAV